MIRKCERLKLDDKIGRMKNVEKNIAKCQKFSLENQNKQTGEGYAVCEWPQKVENFILMPLFRSPPK